MAHQGEGMIVSIIPAEQAPDVMLIVKLSNPTAAEIQAMTNAPLRIAITPSPPIIWFTLIADKLDLDAPYGVAIERRAEEIRASFERLQTVGSEKRLGVTIILLDASSNIIRGLRWVTLSAGSYQALAAAIVQCPAQMTPEVYSAAVQADLGRFPSTDALVKAAAAVEVAGAL
jgi:hypothetical protein